MAPRSTSNSAPSTSIFSTSTRDILWTETLEEHKLLDQANFSSSTQSKDGDRAYATIVQALSVFVLCIVLVAGLWPFHAPRNAVSWLKNENGVRFGRHGIVVSRRPFRVVPSQNGTSCSLEIWLIPGLRTTEGTILGFDSSRDPSLPFSLRQYGTSMAIQRYMIDDQGIPRRPWFKVDHVFRQRKRVLLTITSGKDATSVYVDGVLAGRSSTLGLVNRDLTGRLVVANSTVDDSWPGEIAALAVYDTELTPTQVVRHFDNWIHGQRPTAPDEETPLALYLFNEREGNIVHNEIDPETDLIIPTNYFVLYPAFIRPLWDEFDNVRYAWTHWSYWEDIAVNVAGFIPVGFVFMAYFSSVKNLRRSTLVVVIIGFALSFMIEALQRFLPTRDSGMTDLVTNTAGTAVGIVLYRLSCVQALVRRTKHSAICLPEYGQEGMATDACQSTDGEKVPYSA